jgi:hypothetical protein
MPMKKALTRVSGDMEELLKLNTDALALIGHSNQDLSQHRRDANRPHVNKQYASLCAPRVPITGKLFGDELQSQLNNIKVSNKISTMVTIGHHYSYRQNPGNDGGN